ncbi:MAG: HAMP domain-containing histidine kinase [Saprospiraceae bacterium]|jgi:signal transduction histidine kinase|nr:HAMP domain-containing histidine kinase [Saprospiraceae bacterium]
MKLNRHQFSIVLMSTSLVLLAGFLVLFLKKSWDDEVLALKKETGFLFINSIRGVEGDMMDRLVTHNIMGQGDSVRHEFRFQLPGNPKDDSLKVLTYINEEKLRFNEADSNVNIRIMAKSTGDSEAEMSGSLSMIVAMTDEKNGLDSLLFRKQNPALWTMVDSNFSASMSRAKLPVEYEIVRLGSDTVGNEIGFRSGSYTDLASGDKYVAELSDYQGYIFKKIWPELLFSLGLFGCVSLAFFTVFKNLQAQRRLTDLKNDFIQNVTHELKTPIATVGVAIEALRNFDAMRDPDRSREYLDISKSELNRLSLLVDKVLRMSLFEKTAPVLHLETIDFQAIVSEVLASMRLQFEHQGAQVSYVATGDNFMLKGDRLHLTSVVYNLLDNALKYSPGQPEIAVRLFSEGNEIKLEVADRGIGIAPEHRERIFEKFYRVPTGNVHNAKGHGLGLSYVASVVEQHGGRVSVEEREGGGSVFIIALNLMAGIS